MAGGILTRVTALVVVILAVLGGATAMSLCNVTEDGFTACKPSVTPPNPALPSSECCSAVSGADFECLCSYRNSLMLPSLGIDPDLALALPLKSTVKPQHPSSSMAFAAVPTIFFSSPSLSNSNQSFFLRLRYHCHLKQFSRRPKISVLCAAHVSPGGGLPMGDFFADDDGTTKGTGEKKWTAAEYKALLEGGEQVTSVLQEMVKLLEDMNMDEESEEAAVQLAAHGVIGKRVDQMESGFMMALDYMIQLAQNDQDDKRKSLLEVIKETVLSHLTKQCPPHVQVVGLLCRTPQKESRQELLRRVAAGGGVFEGENGTKVHLPGANLNDIANQADDLLETMETRPVVPDRKLLARLVLIREEARNMMGGGILDERNDRGLNLLPESEVNFLTKLVALRPGKTVRGMIKNVMQGKDEGTESSESEDGFEDEKVYHGISGKASVTGVKPLPVRPGMFLETVSKVLGGIYAGNVSGITAQHLEWVHQNTLQILQEIAF